jgi:hypothetical protein
MAYGEIKGRFREIRASPFDPNMGGEAASVKSTDVESTVWDRPSLSKKL